MQDTRSKPLVSFLVPCFNYARYLPECIQSIQKQTFRDFEILILDDASTDETPQLANTLTKADSRISYHRHDKNIGHLQNYNFGLEQAQGELIWLISADDALASPDVLAGFVEAFERYPRLGYAFCRVQCMDADSQPYDKFIPNPQGGVSLPTQPTLFKGHDLYRQLIKANFVPAPSTIARKACYNQYGLFHPNLTHSGDWYNWLVFCLDWDVWFDPTAMVYYRKHQQNMHLTYEKPRYALENSLLCYTELEAFLNSKNYPVELVQQCQFARLQFMHKNAFSLNCREKLTRLYGKLLLK